MKSFKIHTCYSGASGMYEVTANVDGVEYRANFSDRIEAQFCEARWRREFGPESDPSVYEASI